VSVFNRYTLCIDEEYAMKRYRKCFAGSEVSRRELMGFSVCETMYGPEQDIPQHLHELTYISIVLRGSYTECCESTSSDLETGQVIFHLAGESHSNRFHKAGGQVLNVELSAAFLDRLTESRGIPPVRRRILKSSYAHQLGLRLRKEFAETDVTSCLAIEGLTMELMAEIFRERLRHAVRKNSTWLDNVMEILNDRYNQRIMLDELAALVSVHPVHLARAFRKRYLCSVGDHIRKLRIEAACRELLNTNASISDVALRTGFSDQSHLCRALKQYAGMSPSNLRQLKAQG
jgi:AraC family transcriptional regulator